MLVFPFSTDIGHVRLEFLPYVFRHEHEAGHRCQVSLRNRADLSVYAGVGIY